MQTVKADVSYRDKSTNTNVSLGEIEIEKPETVDEAVSLYGAEDLLSYAHTAYVIDRQREFRDANRPDKPKSVSYASKFKQLSAEKQEELLREAGLL